jgi:adenine-specific DNA-methyltransferase
MKLIEFASAEKLRGGFYTPEPIADFILRWGINGSKNYDILEPSCGDGVFLEQILKQKYNYNSILAVENDEIEAIKADRISLQNKKVLNEDFHIYCNETNDRFDLVVGNPPYIRYQYFDEKQQKESALIFKRAGLTYSKLTNAWVSFVVGSSLLLKEKGKIGFVVPAELLQVTYAQQLRSFLAYFFNKINIVSFERLVFPHIQQEVVLLLCEKDNSSDHKIEHLELKDAEALKHLDVNLLKSPAKRIDFKSNKWTYYFLNQNEIDFLENVSERFKVSTIGKYANVEVGITTGANDFFTVNTALVEQFQLQEFIRPMVGRSVQINSIIFDENDWLKNKDSKAKANLLVFPNSQEIKKHHGAMAYIEEGENKGINGGYKCGIRDDWFVVPSLKISNALFLRRNNIFPKFVLNEAKAYTTDTMHRVFVKDNVNIKALIASYYNSVSLAFSEICGRSYGGGVLELMPNEVEKIFLPYNIDNAEILNDIDSMFRNKLNIDEILKFTDKKILKDKLGFSDEEIKLANSIWKKLSQRRINRGKSK